MNRDQLHAKLSKFAIFGLDLVLHLTQLESCIMVMGHGALKCLKFPVLIMNYNRASYQMHILILRFCVRSIPRLLNIKLRISSNT
jgi:hypothetical protein